MIIPVESFKTIMRELGFEDIKQIIKKWKEDNLLDYKKGKNTRKRFINNGKAIACYVITYDGREYFRESEEERRNFCKRNREIIYE